MSDNSFVKPQPVKSIAVQLDEAAGAVAGFKDALDKAEAAKAKAAVEFEASKQKVRDLHEQLLAKLGDIVPSAGVNHNP